MCGICGIIDFRLQIKDKKNITSLMSSKLIHRGPDDKGSYDDQYVSIGFRRLSILDINNGNQPIMSECKKIVSVFNGEIFNYIEIRNELKQKGYKFFTNTDAEIIPNAYKAWGENFVNKLNGMFSIAIYDKNKKIFFLIRDRVGIKPLYYFKYQNSIIFSSEINSLSSIQLFEKKINFNAISTYLSFRYPTEDEETFFSGLKRVPAGKVIKISSEEIVENSYWKIPFPHSQKVFNEKYYLEKLEGLLNDSVKRQLISDVPLGVFLSGGLDSSLLSAIAAKHSNKSLNTYSVTLQEKGYDESSKAKLVSEHLRTNHHEVVLQKTNFLENLNELINIKGVPASIPHEYALYLLSKEMKKKISVVLSGEGADEFFGGYSRVQKSPFDYYKNKFLKKLKVSSNSNSSNNFYNFISNRYSWFTPYEKENLFNNDFKSQLNKNEHLDWRNMLSEGTLTESYNKVLFMFQTKHLKCLLDRLDTMTMAASVEARVPFLDHNLIEFINSVPFNFKIKWNSFFHKTLSLFSSSEEFTEKNDTNKFLLRKLSEKYLPNKISKAKKLGFPVPLNNWLKSDSVRDLLLNSASRSKVFFNQDNLKNSSYGER